MNDELEIPSERMDVGRDVQDSSGQKAAYEVGYRKPPKATRFPKGRSGNPRGRKKTERIDDIRSLLDGILAEPTQVREGGQAHNVSKLEAVLQMHRLQALDGNPKAARTFFKLAEKAGMLKEIIPESFVKLMEPGGDDGKVIRMYHAEQEALTAASSEDKSQQRVDAGKKRG